MFKDVFSYRQKILVKFPVAFESNTIYLCTVKLTEDIMYKALVEKNSTYEGIFFAAVKTTAIFCRPTCRARKPKKENVEYFFTSKDALLNGYHPCKICKPLESLKNTPDYIHELLEELVKNPIERITDYDLVKRKIEPNKVRRWFKTNHGITFQAYQKTLRINHAYGQLITGAKVTHAAYDSGYSSVSGFTEAFKNTLGSNPSEAKNTNVINLIRFSSPLGPMVACATNDGICLVEFADRPMLEFELKELKRLLHAQILAGANKHFSELQLQLSEYFAGKRKTFQLPLVTPGTEFQNQVWDELQKIPYGKTRSYKQQAVALNNPNAIRAVARANGFNRIAIIIPCHRVIGDDGKLVGYGGGIWRKKKLLEIEGNKMQTELFGTSSDEPEY